MSARRGFSFKVGNIEDCMVAALVEYCAEYKPDVAPYSGELDAKQLREAIDSLTPRFPLFLVSYADGEDKLHTPTGPEIGAPRVFKHVCSFTVICCDDDARGETARRRGAHGHPGVQAMIEDADAALSRMQFVVVLEGDERVLLNEEPLNPAGVEHIAQLPEMTAYARHYDTYFLYGTPDRREPGAQVKEIAIAIFPGGAGASRPATLPGVTLD